MDETLFTYTLIHNAVIQLCIRDLTHRTCDFVAVVCLCTAGCHRFHQHNTQHAAVLCVPMCHWSLQTVHSTRAFPALL